MDWVGWISDGRERLAVRLVSLRQVLRGAVFGVFVNRWTEPVWDRWNPARTPGARGERAAERFLRRKGWVTVGRNYPAAHGELDLVMVDGRHLVFVEVKAWQQARPGQSPAEAVTEDKQRSVALAASEFLVQHHLQRQACRFDVVAVILGSRGSGIRHFPGAFEPPVEW